VRRETLMILRYDESYPITEGAGQRAIADMIENIFVDDIVDQGGVKPKSVRTIEDVSLNNVLIDIKTRDVNRSFSMPNLISIDRLRKNKDRTIRYVFVDYEVKDNEARIVKVTTKDIHEIPWDCLAIQNLGLGQLQLAKDIGSAVYSGSKVEWFDQLKAESYSFYERQIAKFEKKKKELL
jgi:hypothetical protein